jgi:PAS domain S-box-containing protein
MDWASLAELLADRQDAPVALLDMAGAIRLFSGRMEQLVGWRRFEVEGKSWVDALSGSTEGTSQRWLEQAMRGALRTYEAEIRTRDQREMLLLLDLSLVGRGATQGLLVTVQSHRPAGAAANIQRGDLDYIITSTSNDFGRIQQVLMIGRTLSERAPTQRYCFELFAERETPCEDCPVLRPPNETWPRTTIRRRTQDSFELINASAVSPTSAYMSVRVLSAQALSSLQEARVSILAADARLSEREIMVFKYLLLGRTLDEIATILELSRRTVKFHQANILAKLGADSRNDLLRLIGF